MSDKRKIIMDCDPGTDDSVCIVMALTHPDVELLGITTESGNLPADKTTANALRILEYMDRGDIPVAQGMMHPMLREYPKDPYSHGVDGLGNHFFPEPKLKPIDKSPAQFIVDTVLANPGEVTLVCTSCLTNIAIAFMSRPEIMTDVREINVAIDCGGPLTRGMTIWDRRDHFRWEHLPKIRTVFAIDGQKYQQTFYEALGGKQ
ncbi:Inosine-uridine preferring nucleoside hydrolase [Pseudoflavonifractor capillosus ATCC 29799]|uniref:Inosine-uridine preferring nucleoside hydrolase n=1 Tax=Pseudoflavonifractor capillosus ATCC 29799 TaxID=411467 RepID=A6NTE0_9FIRM|nr:nucleoside hydrolase [Pseudoflavonifractor capillosus]EDN00703.1 Inosine-uridine preferring nucleoside hydrolase [Pseudoflavonifractor capillosus ATCC 29799]